MIEDLNKPEEEVARMMVTYRVMVAARFARAELWASRGGLQLLSPDQAHLFATATGALDNLLTALGAEVV